MIEMREKEGDEEDKKRQTRKEERNKIAN